MSVSNVQVATHAVEIKVFKRYVSKRHNWFTSRHPSNEVKRFHRLITSDIETPLVLDIGSGSCSDTNYLKRHNLNVLSVDIDGNADIYGDLRSHLPFDDCSIGAIFCRGVLHILSSIDQINAIKEMHRILQPQGLLYATFMISIFVDAKHPLITVDYDFGMDVDSLFVGRWTKGRKQNHSDHSHYFGKYVGYRKRGNEVVYK